jgi:iron complex outermembrane receptor protein
VANLRFGFRQSGAGWTLKEFLRVDNIGDRKYSGSVIVNEGNSRFFEPAPRRNLLIGISGSLAF